MKKFFQKLNSPEGTKKRRLISLGVAAFALVFVLIMFFVDFCTYEIIAYNDELLGSGALTVFDVFDLFSDENALETGVAFLSIGVSIGWLLFLVVEIFVCLRAVRNFFRNEKRLEKNVKVALSFATILAGLYWLGGIITAKIVQANDGFVYKTNNVVPFIIILLIDAIYAV